MSQTYEVVMTTLAKLLNNEIESWNKLNDKYHLDCWLNDVFMFGD